MSDRPLHENRHRAGSFGSAAAEYDRYRPRYPQALLTGLLPSGAAVALDVGAGTGILSEQLAATGVQVLAVEPDPRMAQVAAAKGLPVEVSMFEEWDPAGRQFDVVVFGSSFHWVEPRQALRKVTTLLKPDGRLALLWNRVTPISPDRQAIDAVYSEFLAPTARPPVDADRTAGVSELIEECGFVIDRRHVVEHLHYRTDDWVSMACTYSNILTLDPHDRSEFRKRLKQCIGTGGVIAENDALAVVCTPR
ncbi:class I SAM-dependent methyltransferase [Mycolicibacterium mageritense]|uniref:Methyltransferase n=1 Tax=Mycolicibacterium mageritense TaxID=53462 RepID=A0AAI8TRS2_MYCME|nr:class I SAM-dependent methyltransferase [Mycolicibacterium mageritense]MCC9180910.1 class I SAM-dependent methyltransferase [Mycolicibacterium mageritense]TXI57708.1 MAG: class I SAM-dependent methyltransferase [Mycolicibacterium mageritense]CDO22531.1 methyltransferase [Mycolicibacterium mageritense DSM 44476 = CIP 104973]BBX34114.1 hypothetical protein MMAGJ_33960 [Mycolicibacterium mageritense]BDY27367.1 putative methyltransferase [Mycolicibacterium mageritense]